MKFTAEVDEKVYKEAAERWEQVYNLYHEENKKEEAAEKAIKLMDKIIQKYISDAKALDNPRLADLVDLEQSLKTIILMRLPDYKPYRINATTGEKTPCLGSSFFTYWLQEAYADFLRGGDGLNFKRRPLNFTNKR